MSTAASSDAGNSARLINADSTTLILKRITWSDIGAHRFELWRTPNVRHGWHVYHYECDVEIGKEPFDGGVAARDYFERIVEREYDREVRK